MLFVPTKEERFKARILIAARLGYRASSQYLPAARLDQDSQRSNGWLTVETGQGLYGRNRVQAGYFHAGGLELLAHARNRL